MCGNQCGPIYGGITQHGYPTGYFFGDLWASGLGAFHDADGVDTGGVMMTVESCISDAEMTELQHPFLYLWRREGMDTGGAGRWRGGTGISFAIMAHHNSPYLELGWMGQGKEVSSTPGLCGSYPASSFTPVLAKNPGVKELMSKGSAKKPNNVDDLLKLPGDVKMYPSLVSVIPIKDGDIFGFDGGHGGGGMGDPLDREPERVLRDVVNSWHSLEMAEKVYGVIIDAETMRINEEATKEGRAKIIAERKRRGKIWKEGAE